MWLKHHPPPPKKNKLGTTMTPNAPTIPRGLPLQSTSVWEIDGLFFRTETRSTSSFWRCSWTLFRRRLLEGGWNRRTSMCSRKRSYLAPRRTLGCSMSSRLGQWRLTRFENEKNTVHALGRYNDLPSLDRVNSWVGVCCCSCHCCCCSLVNLCLECNMLRLWSQNGPK